MKPSTKRCSRCRRRKLLEAFPRNTTHSSTGRRPSCRACDRRTRQRSKRAGRCVVCQVSKRVKARSFCRRCKRNKLTRYHTRKSQGRCVNCATPAPRVQDGSAIYCGRCLEACRARSCEYMAWRRSQDREGLNAARRVAYHRRKRQK